MPLPHSGKHNIDTSFAINVKKKKRKKKEEQEGKSSSDVLIFLYIKKEKSKRLYLPAVYNNIAQEGPLPSHLAVPNWAVSFYLLRGSLQY